MDVTVVPRLAHLLRSLNADVVHGYLFSAEIASRLAGRLAGTRVIVGSERNANRAFRRSNRLIYGLTRRCVDAIIANSYSGAKSNGHIFRRPASDYRVVHNGVDTERFRPEDGQAGRRRLGLPSHCPVVGVFANFKPQKNHMMVFRAFRLILDCHPEARLLLVGERPADSRGKLDVYTAQLDHLTDELAIRHRCAFLGHQQVVEDLYPICDVTALLSLHEGTPNALLESMACAVPVVATNVCDNAHIVRDSDVGFLVAADDHRAAASRINRLLSERDLRAEMGRRARNWVVSAFSTIRLAQKMGAIYVELLQRKTRSHARAVQSTGGATNAIPTA